jgi:hypothetical protein
MHRHRASQLKQNGQEAPPGIVIYCYYAKMDLMTKVTHFLVISAEIGTEYDRWVTRGMDYHLQLEELEYYCQDRIVHRREWMKRFQNDDDGRSEGELFPRRYASDEENDYRDDELINNNICVQYKYALDGSDDEADDIWEGVSRYQQHKYDYYGTYRFNRLVDVIMTDINEAITPNGLDKGEPAIIGWRICDSWDPWVPLWLWNAYIAHPRGDQSDRAGEPPRIRWLLKYMKQYLHAAWRDGSGAPPGTITLS